MSGALGPPISFALLSLFSSSCSIAFLRRGQMLLKEPLPRACCLFYKNQNKGQALTERMASTSVCFFSPFYCEWGCFVIEGWKADAPAGLAAMSSSFCVLLGTFHWHHMQSDWQTSILYDPRGCWKFCSSIYHEKIHILFSFRAYSWINTTQKKQNEMQMAMTQQHMMYTNKHSRFDSWNFNQF